MTTTLRRLTLTSLVLGATIACGGEKGAPVPASETDSANAAVGDPKAAALAATDPPPDPSKVGEFRAAGTEPFWSVQINVAGMAVRTPENQDGLLFPVPLPQIEGKKYHWASTISTPAAHRLDVTIVEQPCSDGMSDKKWTHAATVDLDGRSLKGCAEGGLPPNYSSIRDDPKDGKK